MNSSNEVFDLGLDELFEPPAVGAVEWGEKAFPIAGEDFLELEFSWDDADDDLRTIRFLPYGKWTQRTKELSDVVRQWANGGTA